jgi:hypothetical protein
VSGGGDQAGGAAGVILVVGTKTARRYGSTVTFLPVVRRRWQRDRDGETVPGPQQMQRPPSHSGLNRSTAICLLIYFNHSS